MGLRLRFNLILTAVFALGLVISGVVCHDLLQRNAREEVVHTAELMIEAAQAFRAYTVNEIRPLLDDQLHDTFLPQTVPAYAATQALGDLSAEYREFLYKEATLNPTNPRDRAADWEADLIQQFKRDPERSTLSGVRPTPSGGALYIARPIKITNESCLGCHSTPAAAPASMLAVYGNANGFGWQLNEIVGAQIVSVPTSVAEQRADTTFYTFMLSLCILFLVLYVVLNLMLSRMVIKPVTVMSQAADKVSTGDFTIAEFTETRRDEIGALARSFNRMRRSLEQAMRMIEE